MKYVLLLLLVSFHFMVQGQSLPKGKVSSNYTFKHFTIADGLPQIQVTYLFADSKGFVWVGTKFGLARWDGKKFETFTPKEGAAGRQVLNITEAPTGEILVTWQNSAFNIIRGNALQTVELPKQWNATNITGLVAAKQHQLYVYSNSFADAKKYKKSVVAVYDIKANRFVKETWYPHWMIASIDSDGFVIAAEYNKQFLPTGKFHLYQNEKYFETKIHPGYFYGQNISNYMKLGFYTAKDFSSFIQSIVENGKLQLIQQKITCTEIVSADRAHYILQSTNGTSYYTNTSQELIAENAMSIIKLGKLPSVSFKLIDKEGNLWVATENGLYCFYEMALQEYQFNTQPGTVDAVWSMAKAKDGTYYYASYDKGFWYSTDGNKTWQRITAIDAVAGNEYMRKGAYGSLALSNGAVLLGTGCGFYYISKNKIQQYNLFGKGAEMFAASEDTVAKKVLVSNYQIVTSLNLQTLELDTVLKMSHLGLNNVLSISVTNKNEPILTGSGTPLIYKNRTWQTVKGATNAKAMSSCVDSWNGLWLGHAQKLTLIKDDSAFVMKQFPGRQLVLSLITWKNKWLVIGGGFEIIFLDLETFYKTGKEIYQRFDAGSGFVTTEGGQNSFVHETDGSIWWCCSDKVIRFWPEKMLAHTNAIAKVPAIFSCKVINDKDSSLLLVDTAYKNAFKVSPSFRNLRFEFGAAAMNNYDNLVYRYRLKGEDTTWSQPSPATEALFAKLNPGTYIFEVQSSTDGMWWSSSTIALPVTIPSYWYETMLFKIFGVMASIALIVFAASQFNRRKRKATERQKLINELQLKAIRSKALPHFSGNAFANIDFYIEKGDTENASKYLAILSRLHNITLTDSDRASRTLDEELNYVKLYLEMEKLRFEEKLKYSIEVDATVNKQQQVPNMILHTYAENAIKHGLKNKKGTGSIIIKTQEKNNHLVLSVEDNGIGRAAASVYRDSTKLGLSILDRQIELYNISNKNKIVQTVTDLFDEKGLPAGTVYAVSIPNDFNFSV